MHQPDLPSPHQVETLAGSWHRLAPLELRRLVLEGATLVIEAAGSQQQQLCAPVVLLNGGDDVAVLADRISDRETPLVCLGDGWTPAQALAERLIQAGYKHVFTPDTQWSGIVAMNAVGADDQP